MTVDIKRYAPVDENFKKEVDYKLYAGCVHVELGGRKYSSPSPYFSILDLDKNPAQEKQIIVEAR
jgi:hypothetical protein